jgi:large subunit ribosomal protein L15
MVVNKKRKVHRLRAHVSSGGGHRKKRRGAGSRGGRGRAGSGKRAGHKVAGSTRKLGAHGFNSHSRNNPLRAINVSYFTISKLEECVLQGAVTKQGDVYSVDLVKLGFGKILGTGSVHAKIVFSSAVCTPKAEEMIKNAGGSVNTTPATA